MTDLTLQVEELGRASRRSALISVLGIGVLVASFVASSWKLRGAEAEATAVRREVDAKKREVSEANAAKAKLQAEAQDAKLNRDSLLRDIEAKTKDLESLTRAKIETESLLARQPSTPLTKDVRRALEGKSVKPAPLPPVSEAAVQSGSRVNLSLQPTGERYSDRPVYNVRIWVSMPKELAQSFVKVEYHFQHSSFVPQIWNGFAAGGFSVSYRGYGCVPATATLVDASGGRHQIPFDMCSLWTAAKPKL